MIEFYKTLPSDTRNFFGDPIQELLKMHVIVGFPELIPGVIEQKIAELMNSILLILGNNVECPNVKVGDVTESVMIYLRLTYSLPHSGMVYLLQQWPYIFEVWIRTAVRILANLGYVKLTSAYRFADYEIVAFHASAQLKYENGHFKQQSLSETLKEICL